MLLDAYLIFSLLFTSFIGLIKIFSIVPFNRMASDDFSFAVGFLRNSFFSGQVLWYKSLTGRYAANLMISAVGAAASQNGKVIVYSIISFLAVYVAIHLLISSITRLKFTSWKNILPSLIIFVAYFIITPNQRDSWYWLNGAATYLWPTIFDLVIVSLLLRNINNWWVYLTLFIASILAGGGNETILVTNIILSGVAVLSILSSRYFAKKANFPKKFFRQVVVVFLATLISLTIVYFSPGNANRMGNPSSDPMSVLGSFVYALRDGPGVVWQIIQTHYLFIVPLFISIAYLFSKNIKQLPQLKKENIIPLILIDLSLPVLLSVPVIMIGYLSLGRLLPERVFITIAFLILLSLIFGAYLLSYLVKESNKSSYWLLPLVVVSSFLIFLSGFRIASSIGSDLYIAKNYADAFDKMFVNLQNYPPTQEGETFTVEQLPESGQIRFWQVTTNPADWENKAVSAFFNIKATVVAK